MVKTCGASELIVAVREVLKGKFYLCSAIAKETVDLLLQQDKGCVEEGQRLSRRQREVLQLLTEGKTMKEVASRRVARGAQCRRTATCICKRILSSSCQSRIWLKRSRQR